ncbi:MAG TPA: hypothetical protein VLE91_02615, partial [Candidatus Saccharimonadales bacterium]|nr:hypothetical protein [Candidatus Saccharimonadales bacterium]
MTKNPILNALCALLYITLVACVMVYATEKTDPGKTVLVPIAVMSLFTLSASVMGYIFLYKPFQLYFDGKKKQAVNLVFQTIIAFAVITAIV